MFTTLLLTGESYRKPCANTASVWSGMDHLKTLVHPFPPPRIMGRFKPRVSEEYRGVTAEMDSEKSKHE